MNHAEFVRLRKDGLISAGILTRNAVRLVDFLPREYQFATIFWSWVWMLSIPACLCVVVFWKWWVGLLLVILVPPTIRKATVKSAVQFVLQHAEDNADFFEQLVDMDLLIFRQTKRQKDIAEASVNQSESQVGE